MVKIGIDLATQKTGIVILNHNNELVFKDTLVLDKGSDQAIVANVVKIQVYFESIKFLFKNQPILVGIELANYKNPLYTTRFSFYAGVIVSCLSANGISELKIFNANAGHKLIGIKVGVDTRETTKKLARDGAKEHCNKYNQDGTEDECDAFCIADLLNNIETTEHLQQTKQEARKKHKQKVAFDKKITEKINTRLNKITKLDKTRNAKQIARLNNEIQALKNERKNWGGYEAKTDQ